jgi:hypothetical protein
MRASLLIASIFLLSCPVLAAAADDSPIIIVGNPAGAEARPAAKPEGKTVPPAGPVAAASAEAITQSFPAWAVSKAGADTSGQGAAIPAAPASPESAAIPAAPAFPPSAGAPQPPAAPSSPLNRLWPRDTVPIFMRSCTGLHIELIPACQCVISKMMLSMPHDEFLTLSAGNRLDSDPRILAIRQGCLGTPGERGPAKE